MSRRGTHNSPKSVEPTGSGSTSPVPPASVSLESTKTNNTTNKCFAVYQFKDEPSEDEMVCTLHNERDFPRYASPRVSDKDKLSPKLGSRSPKSERASPKPCESSKDRLTVSSAQQSKTSNDKSKERSTEKTKDKTVEKSSVKEHKNEKGAKEREHQPSPKPVLPDEESKTSEVSDSQSHRDLNIKKTEISRASPKLDRLSPKPTLPSGDKDASPVIQKGTSPKVPPLKIIIPPKSNSSNQTSNAGSDPDNSKSQQARPALPYIVNSTENGSSKDSNQQTLQSSAGSAVTMTTMASDQSKMFVGVEKMDVDNDSTPSNYTSSGTGSSTNITSTSQNNETGPSDSTSVATAGTVMIATEQMVTRRSKERENKNKEEGKGNIYCKYSITMYTYISS